MSRAARVRHRPHDAGVGATVDHGTIRYRQSSGRLAFPADDFRDSRRCRGLRTDGGPLRLQGNSRRSDGSDHHRARGNGLNALVADISSGERGASLNLLGVFFGVGAVGVPFVLGALTGRFAQSVLIAAMGTLVAVPLIVIATTNFPAPKQPQAFPIAAAGRLFRDPLLLIMGLMLFLESGIEITVGGWTSTFVNEELAVQARNALFILSLYWMGMMLARLALGSVLRRASPFRVLYICMTIALIGAAVLLVTQTVPLAAVGVFML